MSDFSSSNFKYEQTVNKADLLLGSALFVFMMALSATFDFEVQKECTDDRGEQ